MSSIRLKLLIVLFILIPIPFSCEDKNECLDLYVEPYFDIQNIVFSYLDLYYFNQGEYPIFDIVDQDFATQVYPCDSIALYFEVPDTSLIYHSQHIMKSKFSFTPEAFACNTKRPGYAGTRELVDRIIITSEYDFDDTHNKNDNLSDIARIFAYTSNGNNSWMPLSEYNKNSPYEAPKRFYILIERKPNRSMTQQFVVKYYMISNSGEATENYVITTPILHVR